mgnify:CR=1 FL=1
MGVVQICTAHRTIKCGGTSSDTAETVASGIEAAKLAGKMFYCCDAGCVAIDKIETVEDEFSHDGPPHRPPFSG